jgi:uridylate kinase
MKLVIKIGGSLLSKKKLQFDMRSFKEYASQVRQVVEAGHKVVLVVGGGALARTLVESSKQLTSKESALDRIGIAATWLCAQLMITALGDLARPKPIMTDRHVARQIGAKTIAVAGGLRPGQSTNAVAAGIAERAHADVLVNVTDVDGVYDKDPKRYPRAELLPVVTASKLRQIVASLPSDPGTYPLFDKRALDIVEHGRIEVWFVDGRQSESIVGAVSEKRIGTRLIPG